MVSSVTGICDYAFYDCSELTSITIEKGVTSIGDYVFRGCGKLTSITYNGKIKAWSAIERNSYWKSNTGIFTVHCTDGDIAKADS
ncbi:MAG: leucine-rich repeat domain-containing protein [Clostridia bacterium]|nr:leucine-rich repeat domain-containing protein [Clostridia bacterium]